MERGERENGYINVVPRVSHSSFVLWQTEWKICFFVSRGQLRIITSKNTENKGLEEKIPITFN